LDREGFEQNQKGAKEMRPCQVCGESDRKLLLSGYDGQNMSLFECDACKHRYVDSAELDQAWFDNYYLTQYTTSDKPYSFDRYRSLALYVAAHAKDVLDIGGKNGELGEHFAKIQSVNYEAIGVGDELGTERECIILSHTLEHVYDVGALMKQVIRALRRDGLLVIEVPIHIVYGNPKKYDYHWQHINKFRPMDLMMLLIGNGFTIVEYCRLPDYREYECWRIAGRLW